MHPLHLSKVAVGCASIDVLRNRQKLRAVNGIVPVVTRFRPKRADELVGGSLFWIVKHKLVARQTILGFAESEEGRTAIEVEAALVPVKVRPKRAHQGWRYLEGSDAPEDMGSGDGLDELPGLLAAKLADLALI